MKINGKDAIIVLLLLALGLVTYFSQGKVKVETEYVEDTSKIEELQAQRDGLISENIRLRANEVQEYEQKPCRCDTKALNQRISDLEAENESLLSQVKNHIPEVIIQPVEKFIEEDPIPIAVLDTSIPPLEEEDIPEGKLPEEPTLLPDIRARWFDIGAGPVIHNGVNDFQISIGAGKGNWGGRVNYQPLDGAIIPQVVYKRVF